MEQTRSYAQVFSPGALTRDHAEWDSLKSCSKCHSSQNKVDSGKCLSCHTSLQRRLQSRKGYHASSDVRAQACATCHKEHRGPEAAAIEWPTGVRERFPHQETGWALEGAHTRVACEKCHNTRRIADADVRVYLEQHREATSFLGLPTKCDACHFDEHRGSVGTECSSCHNAVAWKPAPGFNHEKSWKLVGAHARVPCERCHKPQRDPAYNADAFPKPRAETFLTMKPVAHETCTDCHQDPHRNRFGGECLSCHTQEAWTVVLAKDKVAFHEKTAFPLQGRHQTVPCERCHPVKADGRKLLKPIPHDRCQACHPNAHPDIPDEQMAEKRCTDCHSFEGYLPVRYTLEDHAKTRYPLTDAHLAVPCTSCHLKSLGTPFEAGQAQRGYQGKLSSRVISPWRLRAPDKDFTRCESCHTSPHRDQFASKPCTECHVATTWRLSSFDHNTRTRYRLEGQHEKVACALCHKKENDAEGSFVRYRPLDSATCTPCHADPHYAQFSKLEPALACDRCHGVEGFKKIRFEHNVPEFSDWPLEGRHEKAKCAGCHPEVALQEGVEVTVYRPRPRVCAECHEDVHQGAYAGAGTLIAGDVPGGDSSATMATAWGLPLDWAAPAVTSGRQNTECSACHRVEGWHEMRFDHRSTGFPLEGLHQQVACRSCHKEGAAEPVPKDCQGCHDDVHEGRLGNDCASCHTERGFDDIVMALSRHARTGFPLIGKHAMVPCTECHQDVRDLGFGRTPGACVACHTNAPGPSGDVDHSGFSASCEACHTPIAWEVAAFLQHDQCFPIRAGTHHGGIDCQRCHTGTIPAATGTCSQSTFSCTGCHGCQMNRHVSVNGYECQERKCYQCHPGGS